MVMVVVVVVWPETCIHGARKADGEAPHGVGDVSVGGEAEGEPELDLGANKRNEGGDGEVADGVVED